MTIKIIDGKRYTQSNGYKDKGEAQQYAKVLRKKWRASVRMIKIEGYWTVCWHAKNKIDEFKIRIEIIRPFLKQTVWAPMGYMMIPSVLKGADELILEISNYEGTEKETKEALLNEISDLRKGFHRIC